MTSSPQGTPAQKPLQLVVTAVAGGSSHSADGPTATRAAALQLAAQLRIPARGLDGDADPPAALAALQAEAGPWLTALAADPGAWLGPTGRWCELLGAFRQPTLVVVGAAEVAGGGPAATAALLERAGVPLAGLIQWGGPWEPGVRRAEGLPWLGWLATEPATDGDAPDPGLLPALLLRWQGLDQVAGQSGGVASLLS